MAINYNFQPKGLKSNLGWYGRGYLPHFDGGEIPQFFTFRLWDALPEEVVDRYRRETQGKGEEGEMLFRKSVERFLDTDTGNVF